MCIEHRLSNWQRKCSDIPIANRQYKTTGLTKIALLLVFFATSKFVLYSVFNSIRWRHEELVSSLTPVLWNHIPCAYRGTMCHKIKVRVCIFLLFTSTRTGCVAGPDSFRRIRPKTRSDLLTLKSLQFFQIYAIKLANSLLFACRFHYKFFRKLKKSCCSLI